MSYPWIRPPAVPLVTHDPYFSVWSFDDQLTSGNTRHWTGDTLRLIGLLRVDGRLYRWMGDGQGAPALEQQSLEVFPLRTVYTFAGAGVTLRVTFCAPLLPDDLDQLSRPLTYLTLTVTSSDGAAHAVEALVGASTTLTVNHHRQTAVWSRVNLGGDLRALRAANAVPQMLARSGDHLRIEWGDLYLAGALDEADLWGGSLAQAAQSFDASGRLPLADDLRQPRAVSDEEPGLCAVLRFDAAGERTLMLAYDDHYSVEFLDARLRPYWRRNGKHAGDLLRESHAQAADLMARASSFDAAEMTRLTEAGGADYAVLAALAYRQAMAAHKLVAEVDGTPLFFSKENYSNGCIGTVDITYPSAPLFLVHQPALLRALLLPVLRYASTARWKFPFAPHDLGQYPLANGQVYGGGETSEENQMPVEECGNMLILLDALAKAEGNASLAGEFWAVLTQWAGYLREKGMDPENQLCTDDFAGHLAHNTNLSIKAILGIGAYAQLARTLGYEAQAFEYHAAAQAMAQEWMRAADDGDHYRLTFDRPGTWSQKYNLVWDRLLDMNLFPPEVARAEIASYLTRQNVYGLPLDNRATYTKTDWIVWTATMAERPEDFAALIAPLLRYYNETPQRAPLPDWTETVDGRHHQFRARAVVGGFYMKALAHVWGA